MADNPNVFCVNCGAANPSDSRFCRQCGTELTVSQPAPPPFTGQDQPSQERSDPFASPPPPYYGSPTHIDNNLIWAILATICCCIPTGIVAIVYAAQVNGKLAVGDLATAQRYANNARLWAIISAVLGSVVAVIYLLASIVGGVLSAF